MFNISTCSCLFIAISNNTQNVFTTEEDIFKATYYVRSMVKCYVRQESNFVSVAVWGKKKLICNFKTLDVRGQSKYIIILV